MTFKKYCTWRRCQWEKMFLSDVTTLFRIAWPSIQDFRGRNTGSENTPKVIAEMCALSIPTSDKYSVLVIFIVTFVNKR